MASLSTLATSEQPADAPPANADIDTLRERVVQLDRLASVGQLTAGILHEVKNPLSFITNFARLSGELLTEIEDLLAQRESQPEAAELTELIALLRNNIIRIQENGARASRLVQGMLAQTRQETPQLEPTDLNGLVEEFSKLAYQGVRAGDADFVVSLQFRFDPAVGLVSVAPHEFNRVILNLVLNACYAVNERRKRAVEGGYKPTIVVSSERQAAVVNVCIRDNGDGIPEAVRTKLFTPFFTTKPVGQGTGLGLSLSHDIIARLHHGTLSVASEPGVFTEFCIHLPDANESDANKSPA